MGDGRRVLVVFSDGSLGGTARSAWTMGAAWRRAGATVDFAPLEGVHPQRRVEFEAVGPLLDAERVRIRDYRLVHLHHAQVRPRELQLLARWSREAAGTAPPALLTHDVFAEAGLPLTRWPGPVAVGLLGEWQVAQLAAVCWPHRTPPAVIVPNPQDLEFFRPATAEQRARARARLGVEAGQPVVLRVGSPSEDKWSDAYAPLADALQRTGALLVCAGAPGRLRAMLAGRSAVRLLEPSADAEWLRDLYWAADVLAVDAKQGESFGNVIVEALGCGLPVVYRDRPTRDNTPREFPVVISRGRAAWVRDVLAVATGRRPGSVDRGAIERYSVEGVAILLRTLLDGDLGPAALAAVARPDTGPLRFGDRAAVALRRMPPGRTAVGLVRAMRARVRRRS